MLFNSLSTLLNQCTEINPDILFLSIGGKEGPKEQRFPAYLNNYQGKVLSLLIDVNYQHVKEALMPYDNFIVENNIYKVNSLENYIACCNAKLPMKENTPELQQLKDYVEKLLNSGKTIIIADHSINFPACCSLVVARMYNDLKIQHKDKIQMYLQAGAGATLYLNENLFFPLSPYNFSPDNLMHAREMINTYKDYYKNNPNFFLHINYLIRLNEARTQLATNTSKLPNRFLLTTNEERDNWWIQYEEIFAKSYRDFNVKDDVDYYPTLCSDYGFISTEKKWIIEPVLSSKHVTFFDKVAEVSSSSHQNDAEESNALKVLGM